MINQVVFLTRIGYLNSIWKDKKRQGKGNLGRKEEREKSNKKVKG